MAAIITQNLRFHNSEQFVEAFSESSNTIIYAFIAKPTSWPNNLDTTGTVQEQIDNVELLYNTYDEMMAMKRVLSTDVEYVVPRYNWVYGTVYNYYDNKSNNLFRTDLTSKPGGVQRDLQPFYALDTTTFNVYKCLSNSKGAPSTVRPTGDSANVVVMGDGYNWKYMYTIPSAKRNRFLNADFMYVSDTNHSSNSDGALDIVIVTNGGSGYTSAPNVTITGDGTGATANCVLSGNTVSNVTIIARGSGYRYANVVFSGGGGANAAGRVLIPPKGGHAANARLELGGFYVALSPQLINEESGNFPTDNDFRIAGLIKDPKVYGSATTVAAASSYKLSKTLYLANISGTYSLDEYISGGNSKANAIILSIASDVTNAKANINYFQASGKTANANSFSVGDIVTGIGSGATGNLLAITNQGIEPDSGEILYIDAFRPIQRAADQTETLQLVIEF